MAEKRARDKVRRFYQAALSRAEQADLALAVDERGEAEEVALLRLLLRRALEQRPEDIRLMFSGADYLSKALSRRYKLSKEDAGHVSEQIRRVLAEERGEEEMSDGEREAG